MVTQITSPTDKRLSNLSHYEYGLTEGERAIVQHVGSIDDDHSLVVDCLHVKFRKVLTRLLRRTYKFEDKDIDMHDLEEEILVLYREESGNEIQVTLDPFPRLAGFGDSITPDLTGSSLPILEEGSVTFARTVERQFQDLVGNRDQSRYVLRSAKFEEIDVGTSTSSQDASVGFSKRFTSDSDLVDNRQPRRIPSHFEESSLQRPIAYDASHPLEEQLYEQQAEYDKIRSSGALSNLEFEEERMSDLPLEGRRNVLQAMRWIDSNLDTDEHPYEDFVSLLTWAQTSEDQSSKDLISESWTAEQFLIWIASRSDLFGNSSLGNLSQHEMSNRLAQLLLNRSITPFVEFAGIARYRFVGGGVSSASKTFESFTEWCQDHLPEFKVI